MLLLAHYYISGTFEYNYFDPVGRGIRFAGIEKEKNIYAREIASWPLLWQSINGYLPPGV
jgi:hypothetical protein